MPSHSLGRQVIEIHQFDSNKSRRGETINVVTHTDIAGIQLFRRGKVRDVYAVEDKLLVVATDRISAFDVVLPSAIPCKGAVLTQLSLFWFDFLKETVSNHLITAEADNYPAPLGNHSDQLRGRSMLVARAEVFPVECVARGYLAGSGWKDYQKTGEVCGVRLPSGLRESERLPEPIFTPATKAESGHDINISESEMAALVGEDATERLKELTLAIYLGAARYAEERGIIIADTKFEFGVKDGEIILVDEALTPDSSRFWPKESYQPGRGQQSFDKQFVRDYLETLDWNKQPPGPELPVTVVERTTEKYLEAYRLLTGQRILDFGF
ncbi:MAG TPA: phosphoribosylaminoimidazolesuccinocarboxamide synthase [Blastocatellia bacterium]|nr:phosphoribosylaminoimidazolesuccinocarboxamide synthase [Blastocatellia bacterium]